MAQLSLSSWIVARRETASAIQLLWESGFQRVELSDDKAPLVKAWEADPLSVTERLREAGLVIASIHSPEAGRYLDVGDEDAREASLQANLAYFPKMAAAGVPEMIIHPVSSAAPREGQARAATRARIRNSLARLADTARHYGLRLAVENIGTDASLGGSITSLLELIEGLGEHIGLCHDVGHTVQAGLDPAVELRLALDSGRLFSLHIHDVQADARDHFLPGEGIVDFGSYLGVLRTYAFAGLWTFEIAPTPGKEAERIAQAARVRQAWEGRG